MREDEVFFVSGCEYQCDYQIVRRDCDGDWGTYCIYYGNCKYQSNVRDCDGDVISLCRK